MSADGSAYITKADFGRWCEELKLWLEMGGLASSVSPNVERRSVTVVLTGTQVQLLGRVTRLGVDQLYSATFGNGVDGVEPWPPEV